LTQVELIARFLVPPRRSTRNQVRTCETPRCEQTTRENKPYCSEHVEEHPYVQRIKARLEAQEAEVARVEKRGVRAVSLTGLTSREIVLQLVLHGDRTVARLARDLSLTAEVVTAYVRAMARRNQVVLQETRRGYTVVQLLAAPVHGGILAENEDERSSA
jgi:acetolactate synthase regulatory subunit